MLRSAGDEATGCLTTPDPSRYRNDHEGREMPMPGRQPGPHEKLTAGDRLVSALPGGLCGFGTMLLIWFVVMDVGVRTQQDVGLPFDWTFVGAGAVGAVGFLAGPERMLDVLEKVWGTIGVFLFWRRPR